MQRYYFSGKSVSFVFGFGLASHISPTGFVGCAAWANQTLAVFTLWAITVYLAVSKKPYIITLIPALFMTSVCSTYICIAPEGLGFSPVVSYSVGIACVVIAAVWFYAWQGKQTIE